jgi:hypothetical protein
MTAYEELQEDVGAWVDSTLHGYKPSNIRGPKVIRDGCAGFGLFQPWECALIDSPLLQRLRRIHQTALAFLTYPSAVHTRFEHSLGCLILVEQMASALSMRGHPVDPKEKAHLRLAALLHDCGHLPFSHAAEPVVGETGLFERAEAERPQFFRKHKEHEILSHLIVKSEPFRMKLWKAILAANSHVTTDVNPGDIDLDRVADMILGKSQNPRLVYQAQMINGPMDADKLDYMQRDALFTGLRLEVDLDRLFYTMTPIDHPASEVDHQVLGIDLSGVPNVEQLVFNKILLYSSLYHHHKVRSALCMAQALLRRLTSCEMLQKPSDFLNTDDWELLAARTDDDGASGIRDRIRRRDLPKRVLVISSDASEGPSQEEKEMMYESKAEGGARSQEERNRVEGALVDECGVPDELVFLDFPRQPSLTEAATLQVLRRTGAEEEVVSFGEVHPTRGWVSSYAQYKHRRYVFAPDSHRRDVAKAAVALLDDELRIAVTQQALDEAKHEPALTLEDCGNA